MKLLDEKIQILEGYKIVFIYKLECNQTGEVYYGSTKYINRRINEHKNDYNNCASKRIIDRNDYIFNIISIHQVPYKYDCQLIEDEYIKKDPKSINIRSYLGITKKIQTNFINNYYKELFDKRVLNKELIQKIENSELYKKLLKKSLIIERLYNLLNNNSINLELERDILRLLKIDLKRLKESKLIYKNIELQYLFENSDLFGNIDYNKMKSKVKDVLYNIGITMRYINKSNTNRKNDKIEIFYRSDLNLKTNYNKKLITEIHYFNLLDKDLKNSRNGKCLVYKSRKVYPYDTINWLNNKPLLITKYTTRKNSKQQLYYIKTKVCQDVLKQRLLNELIETTDYWLKVYKVNII
mgnify:CR=1 FL=1